LPVESIMPSAQVSRSIEAPDVDVVNCHAISHDQRFLALCPNNEEIHIYDLKDPSGERVKVISKHTHRVTGLSFSSHGQLVSASEDRQAFVWTYDAASGEWYPDIVELKAQRAATCIAWAPDGNRFAVGLSSREICVCAFDEQMSYWLATVIRRGIKGSITSLSWHNSSSYLATGSTDRQLMVFDVAEIGSETFGSAQVAEDVGAWVNAVAFSPTGRMLGCVAQDSTVRFKDLGQGQQAPLTAVQWRRHPFLQGVFMDDSTFIACGFDCVPVLFSNSGGQWQFSTVLDLGAKPVAAVADRETFEGARALFKKTDGQRAGAAGSGAMHSNTITACSLIGENRFSTSGLDGLVLLWQFSA
jgi:actin related protein 2/3 complex subunit 1A/1B